MKYVTLQTITDHYRFVFSYFLSEDSMIEVIFGIFF